MFALGAWALMWKHPVYSKYLHQNSDTVTMQGGIHADFHRFTEISQIFQNVSETQELDFNSPKYQSEEHSPDPSRSLRPRHLFRN